MSDIAVRVEDLGKCYQIGQAKSGDFRESFGGWMDKVRGRGNGKQAESKEFWALKEINFEIKKGEAVGIIGRNGAGKSTLLKILSRITEPTKGRFEINGRVSSLLEVGTGFHPELSGRENIYLNGTILGMKRREIKTKFDEIIAFSGVEKFIDTPVKHYSSGMKVRLAFSVAAHLEPEILIIDEVLAVGDAEFQKKCLGKMEDVTSQGRTVLFVSHNMGAVKRLCSIGISLKNGSIANKGKSIDVIKEYLSAGIFFTKSPNIDDYRRSPKGEIFISDVNIKPSGELEVGSKCELEINVFAQREIPNINITLRLKGDDATIISTIFSWDKVEKQELRAGKNKFSLTLEKSSFTPGCYYADIGINTGIISKATDVLVDLPLFEIVNHESNFIKYMENRQGKVILDNVTWN